MNFLSILKYPVPLWTCLAIIPVVWIMIRMCRCNTVRDDGKQSGGKEQTVDTNNEKQSAEEELFDDTGSYNISNAESLLQPHKMVLCVNMALKMGKGKIAAQCGHATLGAYRLALKKSPTSVRVWQTIGQAKIAVKVDNDEHLNILQEKAKAAGLVTYMVCDAGHTQVAPGSHTVLAIGPAPNSAFGSITQDLKLM